jgi:tetratricopeptide (TPR) repeat protein
MEISGMTALCVLLVVAQGARQESILNERPSSSWAGLHAHGYAAFARGQYADALTDFQSSLLLASGPEQRAITLSDIGYTLSELDRTAEALAQLEQALALWRSLNTGGDRVLQVVVTMGILQRTLGRYRDAEQTFRIASDSASRGSAVALTTFGDLLNDQGRFIEADQTFEKALKLSPERNKTRARALIGLGYAESNIGHLQTAIVHLREGLALSEEMKSPQLEAFAMRHLGDTYALMGNFASAEVMLKRALTIFEKAPGMRISYAATLISIGQAYGAENKHALAEDAFVRALKLYDGNVTDPRSAFALENLAMIRAQQKRFGEAVDFANCAYAALRSGYGENSTPAANALGTLAYVEEEAGDLERSERDYSGALRILGDDHLRDSNAGLNLMSSYGRVLRKLHRKREAKKIEQQLKVLSVASSPK